MIGLVVRLAMVPVRVLAKLLGVTVRTGVRVGGATAKTGFRLGGLPYRASRGAGRLIGLRRGTVFVAGVVVGLLLAPVPGQRLRAILAPFVGRVLSRLVGPRSASGTDLAETVAFELAHGPRTWHLAQPEVRVDGSSVELVGDLTDDAAVTELIRVAASVPGVATVTFTPDP